MPNTLSLKKKKKIYKVLHFGNIGMDLESVDAGRQLFFWRRGYFPMEPISDLI